MPRSGVLLLIRKSALACASVLLLFLAGCADNGIHSVTVGITLPLTSTDGAVAALIRDGAELAFDEANQSEAIPGYKIDVVVLDSGFAVNRSYDPGLAAANVRKLAAISNAIANVGPQMSGEGAAMSPILSNFDIATVTPSSTNSDLTNPKFARIFRPKGKAVYFRTVATDAAQGPGMANFFVDRLGVKSVYVLDDTGSYGIGIANSFARQAELRGIRVVGRGQLDPGEADYTPILDKIKASGAEAVYYGGVSQAGVKFMRQAYKAIPELIKGGGDGLVGPEYLRGAGFPAAEGWYATTAAPHLLDKPEAKSIIERFEKKFGTRPNDYALTAYDAALVIVRGIRRTVESGKPVNRENVRDAVQATKLKTIQGEISFDQNGDLMDRIISVFQIHRDAKNPADAVEFQYKYLGIAPLSDSSYRSATS